ncbi:MAG: hypothetical protein A3E88_04010 [Legionellales bacterium RIFCSPHIGHO2_12_FULL_35_11]|nr:MAG: hypothetical protein A3E88_04010 [Legionellales bacterium RIFCSPHIGHO2_12_FULL_35_11]
MRQFILEEEKKDIKIYVDQAKIYSEIKNLLPMSTAELVVRVRTQHINKADESDLNAAVIIAQNHEKSVTTKWSSLPLPCNEVAIEIAIENQKKSDRILSDQEQKLLHLIHLIREQGQALSTKDHLDKANQLSDNLKNKATLFFDLSDEDKRNGFLSFKAECLQDINNAKIWSNHRDYQQIFFDILQTLTVIGALIGVAQWFITGRYSLFSTPKTTLLETIEKTKQTLTQLI